MNEQNAPIPNKADPQAVCNGNANQQMNYAGGGKYACEYGREPYGYDRHAVKARDRQTASFIFGLLSCIFFMLPVGGIVLGALGMIFSIGNMKSPQSGQVSAGFVLAIIGLAAGGFVNTIFVYNMMMW